MSSHPTDITLTYLSYPVILAGLIASLCQGRRKGPATLLSGTTSDRS